MPFQSRQFELPRTTLMPSRPSTILARSMFCSVMVRLLVGSPRIHPAAVGATGRSMRGWPTMGLLEPFRGLNRSQRNAFVASLAGWALDAFDFFIYVFALKAIAGDFHTTVKAASEGIFLTLAMRPVGALFFGWLAERFGRRPILMVNIISYSTFELLSAFAPDLRTLLILRALFGFAMGGEWGVGAALALESLPAGGRGIFSGILQEGYVLGYLLASALVPFGFQALGWRGVFVVGAAPALLVLYIRTRVQESPVWQAGRQARPATVAQSLSAIGSHLPAFLY